MITRLDSLERTVTVTIWIDSGLREVILEVSRGYRGDAVCKANDILGWPTIDY